MKENIHDFAFKIITIGDIGVGKSQLIQRYLNNLFDENHSPTLGMEISTKTIEIENKKISLNIWDTMGQEMYRSVASVYYRGATGALLVFDVTRKETFHNIAKWKESLINNSAENVTVLLVGNKSDLKEKRQVIYEEALQFAEEFHFAYIETSAKDKSNVNRMFELLSKEIYKVNINELKESISVNPSFTVNKIQAGESLISKTDNKTNKTDKQTDNLSLISKSNEESVRLNRSKSKKGGKHLENKSSAGCC